MNSKIKLTIVFTCCMLSALAQRKDSGTVKLRGTKLTYPLVEKWIAEFNKEYPGIRVMIAPSSPADSIDFAIASYALNENELQGNRKAVVVSRYVQLPVANDQRPDLAALKAKGLTDERLGALFFSTNTPTFLASSEGNNPIALYVRDRPVCAVKAFATHFGTDPTELKGTGIKGDDQDLAEVVRKDVNGLSFNNLGFIYDVQTRRITSGLAVIPLDLNENGKVDKEEQIYDTLDEVIAYIEKTHSPKFINERVNFVYDSATTNKSAGVFLKWVLTKGQNFQHDFGFLSVDEKLLSSQQAAVAGAF